MTNPPVDPIYARKCDIAFELFKLVEQDRRLARQGVPEHSGPRASIRNSRMILEEELQDLKRAHLRHPN
ncbi:MAG TPA: hypothetical protein VF102_07150 [Gemmatimonadaceae bacterium]